MSPLQGRGYLVDYHRPGSIDNAVTLFERALALDPRHALSQAGLGEAYGSNTKRRATPAGRSGHETRAAGRRRSTPNWRRHMRVWGPWNLERAVMKRRSRILNSRSGPNRPAMKRIWASPGAGSPGADRGGGADVSPGRRFTTAYWASRNWLGVYYRGHGRYELAIQQYQQAVRLTPDNALAYAYLSGMYTLVGRYAESLHASEQSIGLVPTTYGYVSQGMTLYRLRRFTEAVATLEKAKDLRTDFRSIGDLPGRVTGKVITPAPARFMRRRLR